MQEEILIAAIYPEITPKIHLIAKVQDKTRQDKSFTIRAREFKQFQVVVIARKGKQNDISENNR